MIPLLAKGAGMLMKAFGKTGQHPAAVALTGKDTKDYFDFKSEGDKFARGGLDEVDFYTKYPRDRNLGPWTQKERINNLTKYLGW